MNRLRVLSVAPYLVGGAVLWFFTLKSGMHPTVAGVALAFAIPFEPRDPIGRSPSHRVEHFLHKPVALIVLPLFALANTAIVFTGERSLLGDSNCLGIVAGLVVGKPLGVSMSCAMAVAMGLKKPLDLSWGHIVGAGILGGIGFTMSIFIANLAFPEPGAWADSSTISVMIASGASSLLGIAWLFVACRKRSVASDAR
jgi:NhaA family Na+:H+ antiporter